jgi:DNA gyrase/topoisomerase IV subunit A
MDSSEYLFHSSREYAIYVCGNRAIPSIADGLKHGQRIALWLLARRTDKIKTVALGGLMSAERLYVHGDVSANNAVGMLAAPYKNNVPLIEGLGQFGNRVAPVEGIGAPRYTEVRRAKAAEAILYRDLDLVPLKDNYDGSNQEPEHFLPLIPTVLLNGVSGVAVGWSTEILPRSLKGLVQACQDALSGAKTIRGLDPSYARYDVSVRSLGANQYEISGKVELVDTSTARVTELPPGLSIEAFRKRLNALEESEAIARYVDRSTETIDITVTFRRGSIKGWTEDQMLDYLKMREKTTERIVVIDWNGDNIRPISDPADLVREFVAWRLNWYTTRFERLVADRSEDRTYWQALNALFGDTKFLGKIGKFADRKAMLDDVTRVLKAAKLALVDDQVERVMGLPTYRWTKEYAEEVKQKIAALDAEIHEYQAILGDPERLKQTYRGELDELKKLKV